MSSEDQLTETTEPMITMRLSEWLRMDGEIKRLRSAPAPQPPEDRRSADGPLVDALSDYMVAAYGRHPTKSEMWDIYCSTIDAIDEAAKGGVKKAKSDGP